MQDAALAIVTNELHEILLVQRMDVPVWVLPGGGIEANESAEIAAIRETFEETGIHVEIEEHVATYIPVNRFSTLTHLFTCRPKNAVFTFFTQSDEVSDIRFFPLAALPSSLFPVHRSIIDDWENADSVPIVRPLNEASYPSLLRLMLAHPILSLRYISQRLHRNSKSKKIHQ